MRTFSIFYETGRLFRVLADVHPGGEGGMAFKFGNCEFDCAVAAAASGEDGGKTSEGNVEIDYDAFIYCKGAHSADGVAYERCRLFAREHFGLGAETGFVFRVVHPRVARRDYQHGLTVRGERKSFGDAAGLAVQGLGGEFHRCAGHVEFHNAVFHAELFEILPYFFDCHASLRETATHIIIARVRL